MIHRLERSQIVERPLHEVFAFFSEAANLEAITPPWLRFRIVTPGPIEMLVGTLIHYRLRLRGIPLGWVTRIEEWEPGVGFVDQQLEGPYRLWRHRHTFREVEGGTRVRDCVDYCLPLGALGELAHTAIVRRDLERIFDHRHQATERLLAPGAAVVDEIPQTVAAAADGAVNAATPARRQRSASVRHAD